MTQARGSLVLRALNLDPSDVPSNVDINDADAILQWYYNVPKNRWKVEQKLIPQSGRKVTLRISGVNNDKTLLSGDTLTVTSMFTNESFEIKVISID
jgi:hypothetical protein